MIVKVFDHIYISNVYNANDIYHLINLNIGGVLTCFRCMSIEWCHHDPKENRKVFYKDKFLSCKGEFLRDPGGRDSPLPLCHGGLAAGKGSQLASKLIPSSGSAGEKPPEGGDTSSDGATEHSEGDLFAKPYAHYDYVIYPLEIVKKKISKETIDDYVKAMVQLKDDVEVNCVPVVGSEASASADEEVGKYQGDVVDASQSSGGEESRARRRSSSLADEQTVPDRTTHRYGSSNSSGNGAKEGVSRSAEHLNVASQHDGGVPPVPSAISPGDPSVTSPGDPPEMTPLKGLPTQRTTQTVCELNQILRDGKNKNVPSSNIYQMKHMYLDILDTFDENILKHVDQAHAFIDDVIRSDKNVLVHCMAGISRCSSIILSYISKKNGKGIAQNFAILKDRYPFAHPNEGFYRQLLLYERMNYTLDGRSEYHRAYEEITRDRGALERLKCLNLKNEPDATYKFRCKLCRFTLFNDNDVIQHQLDKFKIKKKYGHSCTSIFIEKKEWLLTEQKMKGVLTCPNRSCSAKLGKWSWTGICCSCGYLQTPAFMINASNVDRMKINPD
ncbi:dual specificity protein phosphatase, putative [Plasmodium vivax]|uniref:protein-tyrosine-phosphatase n=4 Tax=Plasmodium vivax TaxID=5855 RepID=A5KBA5_PLAVS|nr:dual-specificity protein phosphatase, putative [Plasmodium vivax]KMZ93607.1 dual-specificity protein phosphatase [Plasmodium vivax Mauritania I]KMZ99895.1 dual-specificity protein phosphatase [Plasmodium vivax North Korean]EDL43383.1 dual-specificity protein phosphatase, putative [Plasmodium vivax]CAI7720214.1 dual specificity protein phosphatase, putative [Plasmodium vivax]VUZ95454.1 dual specificity protein phosphatase, putative [Plasmodium vivax]|eukprot:XP_001613110.1 dual-specificity protein phosphatase [Plasmodium vivax Sal-1]